MELMSRWYERRRATVADGAPADAAGRPGATRSR
jgi:hypothetical protein